MSAISHAVTRKQEIREPADTRPHAIWKKISGTLFSGEAFWFTLSLLLFLALGPFSAIAAVLGVCSLIPKEGEVREPEAIHPR